MTPPKGPIDSPDGKKPRISGAKKREIVLSDRDRELLRVLIQEIQIMTKIEDFDRHAQDHIEHAEDHAQWQGFKPWIENKTIAERKKAEFWSTLVEKNLHNIFSGLFWFTALSIVLGVTGAWRAALNWLQKGP